MGRQLSLTLLALVLLGHLAIPSAGRKRTVKGTAIVEELDARNSKKRQPKRLLKLKLRNGRLLNTNTDPSLLTRLYTGQRIRVSGTFGRTDLKSAEAGLKALEVDMVDPIDILEEVPPDVVVLPDGVGQEALPFSAFAPLKTQLKIITIPIKAETDGVACTGSLTPLPYTLDALKKFVLTKSPAGTAPSLFTLPSAYEDWSQGLTQIDTVNSRVADWVVLPCTGNASTGNYRSWSLDQCAYNNWTPYVEQVVAKMGYTFSNYDLIQYLFPQSAQVCGWAGMGQVGCVTTGRCKQWLSAKQWNKHALWGHEMAHAFSLTHAQQGTDVAGDKSGLMGTCCTFRRHNTVHAWQMGWQNLYQLSEVELPAGDTLVLKLLPQSVKGSKGVRLTPTWAAGVQPFFVGFRDSLGTDLELLTNYKYKVNIYQSPVSFQQDSQKSYYKAGLDTTTTSYWDSITGVMFRRLNGTNNEVFISICRKGTAETQGSCCDGRDSDCNGRGGASDTACTSLMPNCAIPRAFTIRQHVYVTSTSCSLFNATFQAAYQQAAAALSGYPTVTFECAPAGSIAGGRLRIAILIETAPEAYGPARSLAEKVNMAVYNGSFATSVKQILGSSSFAPRTGDGFCVREKETGIDWTPCPPAVPKLTKSALKHSVRLDTLPKLRFG